MGIAYFGIVGDLSGSAFAAKLNTYLIHLAQSRGTDRLSVRKTAAIGVNRHVAIDSGVPVHNQMRLFAMLAKAVLGHMHDLGATFGILQLQHIHVFGPDAAEFECGARGSDRWCLRNGGCL